MAYARQRFWQRLGPATVAAGAVLVGLAGPGCDGSSSTTESGGAAGSGNSSGAAGTAGKGGTGGSAGTAGKGGTGGMAGTAGTGGTGGTMKTIDITAAATSGAIDSTPDSKGDSIYYTALKAGDPGIFKVDNAGVVTELYVNDPDGGGPLKLAAPFGITIDGGDSALFVADTGFDVDPANPDTAVGAILTLGTSPGTPTVVTGTEGYRPRGVDIFPEVDGDTIYFTGVDPVSGAAGVFYRLAKGGGVTQVVTGVPFVNPSGIAVGKTTIYVADALASDERIASIIAIDKASSKASVFVDGVGVGYPAGIALSPDEKTLYVSGVDLVKELDNLLIVDIATKKVTPFIGAGLNENTDAGGLHRARDAEVFSWADLTAGGAGTVYRITFK